MRGGVKVLCHCHLFIKTMTHYIPATKKADIDLGLKAVRRKEVKNNNNKKKASSEEAPRRNRNI